MNNLKKLNISKKYLSSFICCLCLLFLSSCAQNPFSTMKKSAPTHSKIRSVDLGNDFNTLVGKTVRLSAHVNYLDAQQLTYQWQQISGASVSLINNNQSSIQFTTKQAGYFTFQLTATTNNGQQYSDTINITASQPSMVNQHKIQISWDAPTTNEDGSSLTNLAGYEIHYGETKTDLNSIIFITDPTKNTYEFDHLKSPQNYFFCISAYNQNNQESQCSDIISLSL